MIDTMEKATIQDVMFAKALGIDVSEVEELSLHGMKNKMFRKAFRMRDNEETLSQEEANLLNTRLREIQFELEEHHDYDASIDYIVDFNSFVKNNEQYNRFCW